MKKSIVLLALILFVLPFFEVTEACAKEKKKGKKGEVEKVEKDKTQSKYDKLLKKPETQTVAGKFITLHRVGNKLYFEYPVKFLGRELLIASTITETSNPQLCTVGYKPSDPLHVRFDLIDSNLYMRSVNSVVDFDKADANIGEAVQLNYIDPYMKKYSIAAYNADSSAVVFDVTPLFAANEPDLAPVGEMDMGMISLSSTPKTELFFLGEMKAFDDNVSIQTTMTHSVKASILFFSMDLGDVSNKMTRTVLLLPEDKDRMKPRISDSRVGIFLTGKQYISTEEDGIQAYTYANRWRVEPKDARAWERGELVEAVKPIVWYVDNTFPEDWKGAIRKGILRWNQAFEKIGLKNAVQVRDFPTKEEDPEFDPDNLKYSCVRYSPVRTMNAFGPSWVDPKTGEIISASVVIYNDVVKLNNMWRFTQTAQIDPRVRAKKMPKEVMDESLEYVVAHEIGHTLGLMHNMAASSAFPVDSLRSASFTQKYGTTASIMDYARFNYVAQPGDKNIKLTPPVLGCYDEYAIKWLYSPIAGNLSVKEEAKILESWVDEKAGDPYYRYGKQQIASRYDPSSVEEDLGDDPLKAGEYGIKNLKYIMAHLNEWVPDDASTAHRQFLHQGIITQYYRYLMNVLYNVGGIYLTEVKDGTPGARFQPVDAKCQSASLKWFIKQLSDNEWLDDEKVLSKFGFSATGTSMKLYTKLIESAFKAGVKVNVASQLAGSDYTQKDFYDDLYAAVFANTIKGNKLTRIDKAMQREIVKQVALRMKAAGADAKSKLTDVAPYTPSFDEVLAYGLDESGFLAYFKEQLQEIESKEGIGTVMSQMKQQQFGDVYGYGFLREVNAGLYDETATHYVSMYAKVLSLLKSKIDTAHKDDRSHYQAMIVALQAVQNK